MHFQRNLWLVIFLTPALLLMIVFTLWPAVAALGYSLYSWMSFNREEFVGLENLRKLLPFPFRNDFLDAMRHNVLAFVGLMVIQNGLGLALAYALWKQPPLMRFFRATVFLPLVVGFLWKLFLDPLIGPITKLANMSGCLLRPARRPYLGFVYPHLCQCLALGRLSRSGFLGGYERRPGGLLRGGVPGWGQRMAGFLEGDAAFGASPTGNCGDLYGYPNLERFSPAAGVLAGSYPQNRATGPDGVLW